ncbi:MAG: O-antigen ligase family protein [Oscillospiraceae bacterium]|jgi:putative inorganic carbon (HCO3(-)) transporter|nr:O-antigen ligase family protein [Oscillospiraceae bacterium]
MRKILSGSGVYRAVAFVWTWFGAQWRGGAIVSRFLRYGGGRAAVESSVFTRAWNAFHRRECAAFKKTRLRRLFAGSIFSMPYIWCFAALFAAPILPTMAVAGLVAMSAAALIINFGMDDGKRPAFSPPNKYIIIYALMYAAAVFLSVDVHGGLSGGLLYTFFIFFALIVQNSVSSKRGLDNMLRCFAISGIVVASYGIYQYVFGVSGAAAWLDSEMFSGISRVYSTLGNPNVLAEYLLLVIPISAALAIIAKGALSRLVFLGATGIMLVCMLLTFARGGWLGLVVSALLFLILIDRRFILVGAVGLLAAYFLLPEVFISRFTSIGDLSDGSTSYRLQIWLGTLALLGDYWFTGIGPGTAAFNKIYPLYSYNTVAAPHSHNLFLQIVCDAGIASLVIFLAAAAASIRALASALSREQERESRILQIAVLSAMAGFFVQGLTDYSFYNYRAELIFWAVIGLGALTARRSALPERGGARQ